MLLQEMKFPFSSVAYFLRSYEMKIEKKKKQTQQKERLF